MTEYVVHAKVADEGWELHVHDIGVARIRDRTDAEGAVRELLESRNREDARTAKILIDWPDEPAV